MARNLEIKAGFDDLQRAADVARAAGGSYQGTLEQVDTYFHARAGRLKLRHNVHLALDGERTERLELIAYQRPDDSGTRESTYTVSRLERGDDCMTGLAAVLGVRVVVRKRRELWLVGATRIHLDEVEGLGRFVELETVVTAQPLREARREHDELIAALGIDRESTIAGSYSDLLLTPIGNTDLTVR
jgi:adenylate cyclase, class 2